MLLSREGIYRDYERFREPIDAIYKVVTETVKVEGYDFLAIGYMFKHKNDSVFFFRRYKEKGNQLSVIDDKWILSLNRMNVHQRFSNIGEVFEYLNISDLKGV